MKTQKNNNLDRVCRNRDIPFFILILGIFGAAPVANANWHVSPTIGLGVLYDDNTRLSDADSNFRSDTGAAIDAFAEFSYRQQLTDFSITPRIRSTKYNDDSDLDSTDGFLRLDYAHRGQKSLWRLRGNYSSESIRTAERSDVDFDIEDPDEIPADDTARVFSTSKRDRVRVTPEFSYQLSQRTSLRLDGEYQDTSYESDVSSSLVGFEQYSIGTSLGYAWSQRDIVSITARTGTYQADLSPTDLSGSAFGVAFSRRLSERTQFRLNVASDTTEDGAGNDDTNTVGGISVIHRLETTRVIAAYRRNISGNGAGGLTLRDSFSLNVSRDISPRLTLSAGVRAYSSDALDEAGSTLNNRDYLQIRTNARWNYSRSVSFAVDYRYTQVDRITEDMNSFNTDSNQLGLWVYWQPNPRPQ